MEKRGNKKVYVSRNYCATCYFCNSYSSCSFSVLGYIEQTKESEQLYKVRYVLIAFQTTLIRNYGTDGEFGVKMAIKN